MVKLSDEMNGLRSLVEDLYAREIILLQSGRYDEWLTLFSPSVRYILPTRTAVSQRENLVRRDATAYFDDDRESLELRVRRMSNEHALTEVPATVTRYFIQVLQVESDDHGTISATSNQAVYVYRGNRPAQVFTASRLDVLEPRDGNPLILSRSVVLDQRIVGNLSVFF